jgi:hypothetical protein
MFLTTPSRFNFSSWVCLQVSGNYFVRSTFGYRPHQIPPLNGHTGKNVLIKVYANLKINFRLIVPNYACFVAIHFRLILLHMCLYMFLFNTDCVFKTWQRQASQRQQPLRKFSGGLARS